MKGLAMKVSSMSRAAVLLATVALGACVNLGAGKAPAQLYTLSATSHTTADASYVGRPNDALVVAEPDTDRGLATARMVVQVNPTAIAYLKDAYWVERPARLLRNLMADDLRAGGKRLVQLDEDGGIGGTRLGGRLTAIGYDAHAHAAVIRYDATLTDGKGGVLMRRFEVSQPDVAPNGSDVAQALNTAANTLADQVAEWVNSAPTPAPMPQSAPRP